jgi:hypothetical protein
MISDALMLKDIEVTLPNGERVKLRRPSALDFIDAVEIASSTPTRLYAWLAYRHLLREDGSPALSSVEAALDSDGRLIMAIGREAEKLYEEGRD